MTHSSPIIHPQEWPVVLLKEIAVKIGSGATPLGGSSAYLPKRLHFALVRSQNVFDRRFGEEGLAYISDAQAAQLKSAMLEKDDLLLNITGDGVTFGRACSIPENVLPACVNQHVSIIRLDHRIADAGYVLAFLTHQSVKSYIESFNAGGSRRAITKGHIESFSLPLPPLNEQSIIGRLLGNLDEKIALNRRMNGTLEAMARAIFKDWFVDFGPTRAKMEGRSPYLAADLWALFPDRLNVKGEPEGWQTSTLGEIADINPKERLPANSIASYLDMAALPTRGIWPRAPVNREVGSGARFKNGDTLFARITPCLENGKTAFVNRLQEGEVAWGSTEFIVIRPRPPFPKEFGYLLARDEHFREHAIRSMTGTSGRQRVQPEALRDYEKVVPPAAILRHFGQLVVPSFLQMRASELEAETLSQMRDLLLPRLMSGELRVREAGKMLEAVL